MKKNESGRTMGEIISVLVIMGLLSVGGIAWYMTASNQQKADEILNALQRQTILVNAAMQGKSFSNTQELNAFLSGFTTSIGGYTLSFKASSDGDGFVSDITKTNGEPIKGKMCRELITKMSEQRFVSDVDFTLKSEEKEDGTVEDVTVPLNGQYVDLEAICGG